MTWEELNIDIPRGRTTGQVYTTCPQCSHERKKKTGKCLSVNLDSGVFNCKNCYWKGALNKKVYVLPKWENKTVLSDSLVEWFLHRNIGQDVIMEMKITQGSIFMPQVNQTVGCLCFNYFREGHLINVKYRDRNKNFRLHKDAELILYNLDGITGQKEIFITEGECDALVMIQAGFKNTCSVPNGANPKNNNLQYMDSCWMAFDQAESVYIMTDNDGPGNQLADELARRIGPERCYRIRHEYKDVNDALNDGQKITREWLMGNATFYPIVGVQTANDFWDGVINVRKNGFPKGWRPRGNFGTKVSIHPGYQSIITGIPGHGKSEHLDQVLIELGIDYNLRGAYFSPENFPSEVHIIKIIEKVSGKNFWALSISEIETYREWVSEHFYFISPEDGFELKNILNHVKMAVMRYGINWYVIDPWNKLDHQFEGSETSYISRCLDEMDLFNKKYNVHGFLVAHPTKMEKDKNNNYLVPNLYSISGSAHFFNKASLGWTVYKVGQGVSDVHVQKVKFKYWGEIGLVSYHWNSDNGRYFDNSVTPNNGPWLSFDKKVIDFTAPRFPIDEEPVPF